MATKRFSDTGFIVRETVRGLPQAAVKVGKAILSTPVKAAKAAGRAIINPLRKKQELQRQQGVNLQNTDRTKAIKSAISNKDYVYQKGDENLVPEAGEYKGK